MSNVVEFPTDDKDGVQYIFDDGKVIAITHQLWPFRIMRSGDNVAMVCEDTDEPFGELDRDAFNELLMCWLLIDEPELIDAASTATKQIDSAWVDVNYLLPENDTSVIGCCDDDVFECHHYDDGAFDTLTLEAVKVDFWQPLPNPAIVKG